MMNPYVARYALILTALFSSAASAQTSVSGTLGTDTTWTLAGSPYVLQSSVTVPSGITLTIEPGDARQALVVRGRVHATGSDWQKSTGEGGRVYADPDAPVVITNLSDEPAELLFVTLESADFQPKSQRSVVNG